MSGYITHQEYQANITSANNWPVLNGRSLVPAYWTKLSPVFVAVQRNWPGIRGRSRASPMTVKHAGQSIRHRGGSRAENDTC